MVTNSGLNKETAISRKLPYLHDYNMKDLMLRGLFTSEEENMVTIETEDAYFDYNYYGQYSITGVIYRTTSAHTKHVLGLCRNTVITDHL